MRLRASSNIAALISSFLLASEAAAQPDGLRVAPDLIVETVEEVSSEELWHLSVPQHFFSKSGRPPGGVIALWIYDRESRPSDGDWIAVCLLMDGFGDIAEKPVAIRVWGRSPAKPAVTERTPDAGSAVLFDVTLNQNSFTLSHTPLGAVFVNSEKIG